MTTRPSFLSLWANRRSSSSKPRRRRLRTNETPLAQWTEPLEDRALLSAVTPQNALEGEHSVARLWNEALLDAIRADSPRPTVHARNLFHTSVAMYDAWAAFEPRSSPYLFNEFHPLPSHQREAAQAEAVSFAAYRVLTHRFANSPGAANSLASFDALMAELGYDPTFTSTEGNSPAAIGNRVAQHIIQFGLGDGANEAGNYADTSGYVPVNPPLDVLQSGTTLDDPNRWQPLIVAGNTQAFLTPHWGDVTPFALAREHVDHVYVDPSLPPQLGGTGDDAFKEAIVEVIRFSSWLDPVEGAVIDVSPAVSGNNSLGTSDGAGHEVNPFTGEPYAPNPVNRADWGRVLAEFWADGPKSETPPGHWNTIANHVSDQMDELGLEKRIGGTGRVVGELEWDVKLYFSLNGAVHDSAVAAWDIKEAYDYVRPISMIRYMGGLGQSSDPDAASYHPHGLPLEPGLIELVTSETTVAGGRHEHLAGQEGEIAIYAWAGHPADPDGVGGVEWILPEDWLPYQQENFVTPPFAGYISGHSTFSRASAEVLTLFTGSGYFPGGLGTFVSPAGDFLKFENGPTETVELQWATYYDAADEAGLSRLYGGIHVDADDYPGRIVGSAAGIAAFEKARQFFQSNRHRNDHHVQRPVGNPLGQELAPGGHVAESRVAGTPASLVLGTAFAIPNAFDDQPLNDANTRTAGAGESAHRPQGVSATLPTPAVDSRHGRSQWRFESDDQSPPRNAAAAKAQAAIELLDAVFANNIETVLEV